MAEGSPTPNLKYTEETSKNHPGGLKGRKIASKVVVMNFIA